jgi:hypothetical protein
LDTASFNSTKSKDLQKLWKMFDGCTEDVGSDL